MHEHITHWNQPDVSILVKHFRAANDLRVAAAAPDRGHLDVHILLLVGIVSRVIRVPLGIDPHKRPTHAWSRHGVSLVYWKKSVFVMQHQAMKQTRKKENPEGKGEKFGLNREYKENVRDDLPHLHLYYSREHQEQLLCSKKLWNKSLL